MKNSKTLNVKFKENKAREIIFSLQNGKFSEDDFKGEFYTDGRTMLFNLDDGRQFRMDTVDILSALKEHLNQKS